MRVRDISLISRKITIFEPVYIIYIKELFFGIMIIRHLSGVDRKRVLRFSQNGCLDA